MSQSQSNPLGSGLGYLEHICQLIEKIGQLQEHNLKLQKQICILQKDRKMKNTKEVGPINSFYFHFLRVFFFCSTDLTYLAIIDKKFIMSKLKKENH